MKKAIKKKATKKKAASKKAAIKVVPLDNYAGWRINRGSKTHVSFGCGAVRVAKADLRALAALTPKEKKEIFDRTRLYFRAFTVPQLIKDSELRNNVLKAITSKPNAGLELVLRVLHAARHRRSVGEILRIPSTTLLGIAGN